MKTITIHYHDKVPETREAVAAVAQQFGAKLTVKDEWLERIEAALADVEAILEELNKLANIELSY
jgi:uncharacterized protein (DUF1330 family)